MKPMPPRPARGPVNPQDLTVKQGFSVRHSLLERAKARALETHGGNLSLYLSHLIERDTGDSSVSLESISGEVGSLRDRLAALESRVDKIAKGQKR